MVGDYLLVSELILRIAGVQYSIEPGTLYATFPANGRSTLTCRVVSEDGSFVPDLDADVQLSSLDDLLFGGVVMQPRSAGVGGEGFAPTTVTIDVAGHAVHADKRSVNLPLAAGTLKTALSTFVTGYLSTYGVTLDPSQVDGPLLPASAYVWVKATEFLNSLSQLSHYIWEIDDRRIFRMVEPGTVPAPFNIIDGDGHAIGDIEVDHGSRLNSERPYANFIRVIAGPPDGLLYAEAYNTPEITAHSLWEMVVAAPQVTTQVAADALAASLLADHLPTPKKVFYSTYKPGLRPGQTQTITVASRGIDSDFLITEVQLVPDDDLVIWKVEAIEGSVYQGDWRDGYQNWSSSLPSSGGAPGLIPVGSSGALPVTISGSGAEAVKSSGPTWVPASAIEILLNTVELGKTAVTVTVGLRADAGTVTARLINLTDTIVVGMSSAYTGAEFQLIQFNASLTPGNKRYRLELLGSVANARIAAAGGNLK